MRMTNEQLAGKIKAGEKDYALQLWQQTERFIGRQAGKYMRGLATYRGIDEEDLKQSGFLALMDAAEHYDPEGGASFVHFLSFYLHSYFAQTAGLRTDCTTQDPVNSPISLDRPATPDSDETLGDLQGTDDHELDDAESRIYNDQLRAELEAALEQLRPSEARAIRDRYFLDKTLQEAAEAAGVTPEMIRQRERHALRVLNQKARAKKNRLLAFIELSTNFYTRTNFQNSQLSPVEKLAIYREQMEAWYNDLMAGKPHKLPKFL